MMQKKRVANILMNMEKATCKALRKNTVPCVVTLPKSEMFLDSLGYYWCPEHKAHGELLFWAARHNHPAIAFRGKMWYALGVEGSHDNKMIWERSILMGNEDMIAAASAFIHSLMETEQ